MVVGDSGCEEMIMYAVLKMACLNFDVDVYFIDGQTHQGSPIYVTPLHFAARRGDVGVSRLLLERGSRVNANVFIPSYYTHEKEWGHGECLAGFVGEGDPSWWVRIPNSERDKREERGKKQSDDPYQGMDDCELDREQEEDDVDEATTIDRAEILHERGLLPSAPHFHVNLSDGCAWSQYQWGLVTPLRVAKTFCQARLERLLLDQGGHAGTAVHTRMTKRGSAFARLGSPGFDSLNNNSECWTNADETTVYFLHSYMQGDRVYPQRLYSGTAVESSAENSDDPARAAYDEGAYDEAHAYDSDYYDDSHYDGHYDGHSDNDDYDDDSHYHGYDRGHNDHDDYNYDGEA